MVDYKLVLTPNSNHNYPNDNDKNQVLAPHSKQHLIFVPSVIAGQQEQILQVMTILTIFDIVKLTIYIRIDIELALNRNLTDILQLLDMHCGQETGLVNESKGNFLHLV